MSTAVHARPVLGSLIIAPGFVPRILRWMAFSIIYHHHDSAEMIYYSRRGNSDDVDGSTSESPGKFLHHVHGYAVLQLGIGKEYTSVQSLSCVRLFATP